MREGNSAYMTSRVYQSIGCFIAFYRPNLHAISLLALSRSSSLRIFSHQDLSAPNPAVLRRWLPLADLPLPPFFPIFIVQFCACVKPSRARCLSTRHEGEGKCKLMDFSDCLSALALINRCEGVLEFLWCSATVSLRVIYLIGRARLIP